ncbi:MAG TPA: pitrilysin family protein [Candidatus Dormibacteraeota bacterium]|nr:pitrilysin family protein [Candidatus Dormibacteraeota bacterium]
MSSARQIRLDNDLVVIARPNRAARSVAVRLVLEAGAAFDPPGREGTAALVADLLDRGAGSLPGEAIASFFDDLGVAYAASARRDTTEIELRLLSRHLSGVLERVRLIAAEPTFPETEIRREKDQALTAIAERDQDTAAVAEMELHAALFPPGHPYHHPRLGTRDSVTRIDRPDLAAFHRARYRPGGTILSLAGDFDPARVFDLAARVFGSWATPAARGGTTAPPARVSIPDPPAPEKAVVVGRSIAGKTQADIALGFRGLRRLAPDLPSVLVLNSILGEFGLGGRLGKAIRDRAGLAYYAYSHFTAGLGAGPFAVRAGVAPDGVRRAIDLMRRTITQIVRRGVTPSELRDSRQALASSIPRRMETNPEAAAVLADAEFHGLGIDYPERLPGLIGKVTRNDVEDSARTYLTPDRSVLVVAGPAMEKEALS